LFLVATIVTRAQRTLIVTVLPAVVAVGTAFVLVASAPVGAGFAAPIVAAVAILSVAVVVPVIAGRAAPISLVLGHSAVSCEERGRGRDGTHPLLCLTPSFGKQFRLATRSRGGREPVRPT